MIIVPQRVDPPLLIFAIPPLALFFFKVAKIVFLYQRAVGVNLKDAFCAAVAGLALSHTIAKAVLYGFFTTSIPFFRTPKMRSNHGLMMALAEAREEVFVMLLLWGAAIGIGIVQGLPSADVKFCGHAAGAVAALPRRVDHGAALLGARRWNTPTGSCGLTRSG